MAADGPVKRTVCVSSRIGASQVKQYFSLCPGLERIDVEVHVDWHEKHRMLKLRFPVNLAGGVTAYEIPYGHIIRPANGQEESMQNWIDVTGTLPEAGGLTVAFAGVSILNDGKYSADVSTNEAGFLDIGLTVLRSPVYAHHDPAVLDPAGDYHFIDQGWQQFRYTILPHAGSWQSAGTVRQALEINQPAFGLVGTFHPNGGLPQSDSFITVEPESILVSVIKPAEDGQGFILRAFETSKQPAQAVIELPAWKRTIRASFNPCEIKTFLIPLNLEKPVVETNLIET